MQQKIVITGGPGTGKTSIIKELEKRNYFCYHEVIRELTLEAKKEGSLTDLSTNPIAKVDDSLGFNLKILKKLVLRNVGFLFFIEANQL